MNLYLIFALALGAISGTATTSVAAPQVASIVAARREHAAVAGRVSVVRLSADRLKPVLHSTPPAFVGEVPLSGGATPRAPARNC